ncbi:MAG TPA: hypothetical protein VFF06_12020 [Polyangia bacterium]|nr:hypothetical protein [Polyangia bacterium]
MRGLALIRRPADLVAVRASVALGETSALAVLPAGDAADELLGQACAAGAVRAVRLWDDALESTDYLGVAIALAAATRALAGDLASPPAVVWCGERGRGAVGPALAERLQLPHLGAVLGASSVEGSEDRLVVRRRSGTVVRLYAGSAPAVLCVAEARVSVERPEKDPAREPAEKPAREIEVWNLERAGLNPAELSYRRRFRPYPEGGPTRAPLKFADARELAARLRADGLIGGGA